MSLRELPGLDGRPLYHSLLPLDLTKKVADFYEWNMHYGAPELLEEILNPLWTPGMEPARVVFYQGALEEQKRGDPHGRVAYLRRELNLINLAIEAGRELEIGGYRKGMGNNTWYDAYQYGLGASAWPNWLRSINFHSFYWKRSDGFHEYFPPAAIDRLDGTVGQNEDGSMRKMEQNELLCWSLHREPLQTAATGFKNVMRTAFSLDMRFIDTGVTRPAHEARVNLARQQKEREIIAAMRANNAKTLSSQETFWKHVVTQYDRLTTPFSDLDSLYRGPDPPDMDEQQLKDYREALRQMQDMPDSHMEYS